MGGRTGGKGRGGECWGGMMRSGEGREGGEL